MNNMLSKLYNDYNELSDIVKNILIELYNNGIVVNYIQRKHKDDICLVIIGDQCEDVKDQKWCQIIIVDNSEVGFFLSDTRMWIILDDFITLKDSIKLLKEFFNE